jgi:hypothetical protein
MLRDGALLLLATDKRSKVAILAEAANTFAASPLALASQAAAGQAQGQAQGYDLETCLESGRRSSSNGQLPLANGHLIVVNPAATPEDKFAWAARVAAGPGSRRAIESRR